MQIIKEESEIELENDKAALINEAVNIYKDRLCRTCNIIKTSLVSHCRTCNHCIKGFDHHCEMTNSCIGIRNRLNFILFCNLAYVISLIYIYEFI